MWEYVVLNVEAGGMPEEDHGNSTLVLSEGRGA